MRSDPFSPIHQRTYCCCHLHRCHLKRLSKRHRCQFYLPYIFLLVHDRCSLSRKIYICLPHQSEFFKIFIKILCSKPHPYFNKNRITGILHPLYKRLGFWDSIQLNEKQEASLKKVYDESFSGKEIDLTKSEYQQDEPLAAEAKRILDDIALVGWTSGGHSGGYVPVFAIGAGAQLFQGRIDNTEIPVKIAEAAGYPNN